jgi:hypothetical protein
MLLESVFGEALSWEQAEKSLAREIRGGMSLARPHRAMAFDRKRDRPTSKKALAG